MVKETAKQDLGHVMTKYEIARVVGARALQISMGAPFLIKVSDKDLESVGFNPIEIAKKEFEKGVIPITVTTPLIRSRSLIDSEKAEESV